MRGFIVLTRDKILSWWNYENRLMLAIACLAFAVLIFVLTVVGSTVNNVGTAEIYRWEGAVLIASAFFLLPTPDYNQRLIRTSLALGQVLLFLFFLNGLEEYIKLVWVQVSATKAIPILAHMLLWLVSWGVFYLMVRFVRFAVRKYRYIRVRMLRSGIRPGKLIRILRQILQS